MKHIAPLALLFAIALPACHDGHQHGHEAGQHVHDAKIFLTAYGSQTEFFAEADPLFSGGESHFFIQLSRVEDFKPQDSVQLDIRLDMNGEQVQASPADMHAKGTFSCSLKPVSTGKGNLLVRIEHSGQGKETESLRIPVEVFENEHQAHHTAEAHAPSNSNTVAFPKAQSRLIDFKTEPARSEKVGMVIATVARIQPVPGAQSDIIAKASGIVSFQNRSITEGQAVGKGEELFSIECGGMMENSIHQYYAQTVNEYEKAKQEYERKKELSKSKIVSESELLQARTDYENASANYEHLLKNFSEDRQIVSSPLDGYIKQINVQNGQFVQAGQPMLTVSQNRKLLLQADLPVKYYPYLQNIAEANIREMNASKAYSMEELHGKLVSYGQSAQEDNPLIPVIFEIDNVLQAVPGTFVNLYLKIGGETPRLSVPNTALVEEMGNYFVFVQITPELFEKRPVVPGSSDGFRTEITDGLAENERIVSRGAQIVKLSQGAGTLDPHAGHVH